MENENITATATDAEREKFNEEIKAQRRRAYDKIVLYCSLALFSFSAFLSALLTVCFVFVGVSYLFNTPFSIIGLIKWVGTLPDKNITSAEALLSELGFGLIFFVVYIIVCVGLIKNLVAVIKKCLVFLDLPLKKINHKQFATEMFSTTAKTYASVIFFLLLTMPTSSKPLPAITVTLIVLFAITLLAETGMKATFRFYQCETKTLDIKQFALYCTKRFALLLSSGLTVAYFYEPFLKQFVSFMFEYYSRETYDGSITYGIRILLPLVKYLLYVGIAGLFTNTIKLGSNDLSNSMVNYDGKTYCFNAHDAKLNQIIKKRTPTIILFCTLFLAVDTLMACFTFDLKFVLPANFSAILTAEILRYLPIILTAIALRFADKIPAKRDVILLK